MYCIYCRREITDLNKSIEHVFPQALGCPDSWTIDCVCYNCNNTFGKTIDRCLASDSIEGLWRLQNIGSHSKKAVKQTHIKIKIPDEVKYGEFRGAIVYIDFSQKDSLLLPPQVFMIEQGKNRQSILIEDIKREEVKKQFQEGESRKCGFFVLAQNKQELEAAIQKVKEIIPTFKPIREEGLPQGAIENDGKLEVMVEDIKDTILFRAISKIALNYLTKIKGADFVLNKTFDIIRQYINSSSKPEFKIVTVERGHLLGDETDEKYFFRGHIFIIDMRGTDLIAKIALTNQFNYYYLVRLGKITSIYHFIKIGCAYSLDEKKILDLSTQKQVIGVIGDGSIFDK